ncbi:MAG: tyrosine protein kinase [Rhizobacter sp.]|nr:tyrosine protein kinase [Rhizobacter sp.]
MKKPELLGGSAAQGQPQDDHQVVDRSIGEFIRELRNLDDRQVEEILGYQRKHRLRFGEAAVALKLASNDDVLWALSQQFHYPFATKDEAAQFNDELIVAIDPFSDHAEMFRDVRSQLLAGVMAPDQPKRALAVCSPNTGDGKTFFACNLAISFSQLGGRTLLIDGDMRTPRLQGIFGVKGHTGLSQILAGRAEGSAIHQTPAIPTLYVLGAGAVPPNPLELIQRSSFDLLIKEMCNKFDYVIVDTPAAIHGADARMLASKCGAALLIGRRGASRVDAMQTLITQVTKGRANLAGVLINEH